MQSLDIMNSYACCREQTKNTKKTKDEISTVKKKKKKNIIEMLCLHYPPVISK